MRRRLFLVEWDADSAGRRAAVLRGAGWEVAAETEDGGRAYPAMRADRPEVVVIDLARRPSHGREVAKSLQKGKAFRSLPLVLVDGDNASRERLAGHVPDAIWTTSDDLLSTLERLAHPVGERAGEGAPR
jgi:CheY-like chemotaxis protein